MEHQETQERNPFAAPEPATVAPTYDRDDEIMAALGLGDPKKEAFTTGQFLAGWLFLASAGLALLTMVLFGTIEGLIGMIFDCLVGGLLVARKYGIVGFAKFRALVTALFGVIGILMGNLLEGVIILIYASTFLNLLIGNPGLMSRVISCVICGLILALPLLGALLSPAW